jgi:hypothetical protein
MSSRSEKMIAELVDSYLDGKSDGRTFVRQVDDLVGGARLSDLGPKIREKLDVFHESLSLCVWDSQTEAEAPCTFIREHQMRDLATTFRDELRRGE